MKLLGLFALVLGIGTVQVAQAQTVINATYTTSAACVAPAREATVDVEAEWLDTPAMPGASPPRAGCRAAS